ncbi:hypothetical protein LCGC14_2400240 [marine sediment metagenome]|uniref:Uncharacterized protein n=1 Tax=marine sediment metagenome TaxID=412755 RepID=A0A0F9BVN1_9ZZZZ
MVFLPVAGQHLAPLAALTALVVMDLFGPLPNVPRALRDGSPGDVLRLGVGLAVATPLGLLLLSVASPELFRYGVSLAALILLALLIADFRYAGPLSRRMTYGVGALGGLLNGVVGMPGPPAIMLYMASPLPVSAIRANLMLYLILADILLLVAMWLGGGLDQGALVLGVALVVPYTLANIAGAAMFGHGDPRVYRGVAYCLIAGSALAGLPLLD